MTRRLFDIDPGAYQTWRSGTAKDAEPLTAEKLERAIENYRARVASGFYDQPEVELHHPQCPRWTTQGQKACRCGTNPLEALLEDDMLRGGAAPETEGGGE